MAGILCCRVKCWLALTTPDVLPRHAIAAAHREGRPASAQELAKGHCFQGARQTFGSPAQPAVAQPHIGEIALVRYSPICRFS